MTTSADVTTLSKQVYQFIDSNLLDSLEWPQLQQVIHAWQTRHANPKHAMTDVLPCLASAAVGGSAEVAVPIASYWTLLFLASKIFDSVQDNDEHDQPWMLNGPNDAISFGLGLVAAGSQSLTFCNLDQNTTNDITRAFSTTWALAAKSQTEPQNDLSLDTYFNNIIASTGQLFCTATWVGARAATNDPHCLQQMRQFGLSVGIWLAILSDCHGLRADQADKPSDIAAGIYKLPVIYAASLTDHPKHPQLMALLQGTPLTPNETKQALSILDDMQAIAWSYSIAEQYRQQALSSLSVFPHTVTTPLINYVS